MNYLTSLIDMIDLSLFESLSSRAMTTQLAMMVMMMIHSKGGQFTWKYTNMHKDISKNILSKMTFVFSKIKLVFNLLSKCQLELEAFD